MKYLPLFFVFLLNGCAVVGLAVSDAKAPKGYQKDSPRNDWRTPDQIRDQKRLDSEQNQIEIEKSREYQTRNLNSPKK